MDEARLSGNPDVRQAPQDDLGQIVLELTQKLGQSGGEPEPLSGGITNRNYRATFGDTVYVIRVPGKDTSLLGINRSAEFAANAAAAEIGVAAPVAAMLTDPPAIVTHFIEGRPMEPPELRDHQPLCDVADALRVMHAAPAIPSRFDSFRIVEQYERVARDLGVDVPAEYAEAHACAIRIEERMSGPEHDPVPCHNDLLAANFIWDGMRVRIVDWEYAGMGDRYFDLANFAVNNELPEGARHAMLAHYFRRAATKRQTATLHLFTFMSDFREAMWGVVQQGASDIDFDFADYTRKHFARLAETAEAPEFAAALEAAGGD
ncbi:MAG TPA: phosphotransferase [Solirubrobacterales bacterium]|nr:phosphotransferase [Solirubrobacterales bacterium]